MQDIKTSIVNSETVVNAKGVKFNPFPLYTKVTTSCPRRSWRTSRRRWYRNTPANVGIVRTVPRMLKRKDAIEAGLKGAPAECRVMSHPTQYFAFPPSGPYVIVYARTLLAIKNLRDVTVGEKGKN